MNIPDGTKVKMPGVINAVVVRFLKKATKKYPAMYQIEYTVDDELERELVAAGLKSRRHQQPRYENQFAVVG